MKKYPFTSMHERQSWRVYRHPVAMLLAVVVALLLVLSRLHGAQNRPAPYTTRLVEGSVQLPDGETAVDLTRYQVVSTVGQADIQEGQFRVTVVDQVSGVDGPTHQLLFDRRSGGRHAHVQGSPAAVKRRRAGGHRRHLDGARPGSPAPVALAHDPGPCAARRRARSPRATPSLRSRSSCRRRSPPAPISLARTTPTSDRRSMR